MFTLCSSLESVVQAIQVLSAADYVILDCEGRNLGTSSGALSLISLGTPDAAQVYLFDVLLLPRDALRLLFNAIFSLTPSARAKTKVVWDGRMDYVELYYSYTCPIENVLDLQLVDVLSRRRRGESDSRRLCRFARRTFPVPEIRKLQLEEVHALIGMDSALREHKIKNVEFKNKSVLSLQRNNQSDVWMQRPLSHDLLAYAAGDIYRIAKLYDHFLKRKYLKPLQFLLNLSSHYVSMHRQTGKPEEGNIFIVGPYLPLTISLKLKSIGSGHASEMSKECAGCRRTMLERHFPTESFDGEKEQRETEEAESVSRSTMCKICTLILAKLSCAEKLKEDREHRGRSVIVYAQTASDADNGTIAGERRQDECVA